MDGTSFLEKGKRINKHFPLLPPPFFYLIFYFISFFIHFIFFLPVLVVVVVLEGWRREYWHLSSASRFIAAVWPVTNGPVVVREITCGPSQKEGPISGRGGHLPSGILYPFLPFLLLLIPPPLDPSSSCGLRLNPSANGW